MSAVNVKSPNWGAGFRAATLFIPADFPQVVIPASNVVIHALVCPGGYAKCDVCAKYDFCKNVMQVNKVIWDSDGILLGNQHGSGGSAGGGAVG